MNKKTLKLTLCGVFIALMCISAIISFPVPFSPAPITMQTAVVFLVALLLGKNLGTLVMTVYLLMGTLGMPVFSGFGSGIGHILGVTGGFLIGFIPASFVIGFLNEKLRTQKVVKASASCIAGLIIIYLFGVVWFSVVSGTNFVSALFVVGTPFIPGDLIKMVLAIIIYIKIEKHLRS
ncbi:MAG: biotin transporter BioY [Defluviitaleaceae bacterium]|nr:biotin transporter BioY [Defluviitaleaceae bacterium]